MITAPASIAWLFNIRGGDVIRSPLPLGQAILAADGTARLFLDPAKVTPGLAEWLGDGVSLERPDALPDALSLTRRQVGADRSGLVVGLVFRGAGGRRRRAWCAGPIPRPAPRLQERRRGRGRAPGPCPRRRRARALPALAGARDPDDLPDEIAVVAELEGFREATGALKDLSFDTIAGAGPTARSCTIARLPG